MRVSSLARTPGAAVAALLLLSTLWTFAPGRAAQAQQTQEAAAGPAPAAPADRFRPLAYRQIGPFRGGRVAAVAGVPTQPFVYYFGATAGG
jgi:hypothetical protein